MARAPDDQVAAPRVLEPADVVGVAGALRADGARLGLWPVVLGADPAGPGALLGLLPGLAAAGLAAGADLTVPVPDAAPDADRPGRGVLADVVRRVQDVGATVTLVAAGTTSVEALLDRWHALRDLADPTGVALSARLARTEADCRAVAGPGVRVRLVRRPPGSRRPADGPAVAGSDADLSFLRCLSVLLAAAGRPSFALSDPRLAELAAQRAAEHDRPSDTWELLMPYAVRPAEQARQRAAGRTVRAHVPVAVSGTWSSGDRA